MTHSHRRHDISDKTWALLEPHLPGREGSWGGVAKDNRLCLSTPYSGSCARARHGVICRRIWGIGATHTGGLFVGATRVFGRDCWKP